jgi:hypothetical protein
MAQSRSAPVVVDLVDGWERALAAGIDEAVVRLADGFASFSVTTTPISADSGLKGSGLRRVYGSRTNGVVVTVTSA